MASSTGTAQPPAATVLPPRVLARDKSAVVATGTAPAATAARRQKARLKSRRRYHQKIATLTELRAQVAVLEKQLETFGLASPGPSDATDSGYASSSPSLTSAESLSPRRREKEALVRCTLQNTVQLTEENTQLRRIFQQRNQQARRLQDLLAAERKLYVANASYFFVIKPLTRKSCDEIQGEALQIVRAFTNNRLYVNLLGCISGWPITRVVERGLFHYALQKTFYGFSADYVVAQSWALLTEPERFCQLYSDALGVRVQLVQKVDDDNLVFFQEMSAKDPDNDRSMMKSMLLMSRLRVPRGYLILIRGLDQGRMEVEDLVEPLHPPLGTSSDDVVEIWNEQFCWLQIEKSGDKDENCLLSYCGITPTVGSNAYFWMVEVVLHCLRWESTIFGPRFSLPK